MGNHPIYLVHAVKSARRRADEVNERIEGVWNMAESWSLGQKYERPRRKGLKVLVILCTLMAITILPALAAKGGAGGGGKGHGGNTGGTTATGSFSLRLVDPTSDGKPHYNHAITFDVTTNAPYPFVRVKCYQNNGTTLVYDDYDGFFVGWLWGTNFGLFSPAWPGGAADCTAVLSSSNLDGSNPQTLSTMTFLAEA